MTQNIAQVALLVRDYDEAIDFYVNKLKFELVEDTSLSKQNKRWVVVAPRNSCGASLLLAKASKPEQSAFIGNQSGGRVFLFLETEDFDRDYSSMKKRGVQFNEEPRCEEYGRVVVFEDLYGNKWDLLEKSQDKLLQNRRV